MKLRGVLSVQGTLVLSRGFLPTLEKFGKTCQALFGPDEVHLVQTGFNTDGLHSCATFHLGTLFEGDKYTCQSKHHNLIAFQIDVGLLLRVLKSATANNAETVSFKLTTKKVTPAGSLEAQSKPFLSFTTTGTSLHMVQDVPVSKPYSASDIDALAAAKSIGSYCPFYIDLLAGVGQAQAVADRLRGIDDAALLATSKSGDFHLLVENSSVALGVQLRELPVYPNDAHAPSAADRSLPAAEQLHLEVEAGAATCVCVQLKQLGRVLQAHSLTDPAQLLCGIADGGGHVHIMYVFRDPNSAELFDENVQLSFILPVREQS